MDDLGLGEDQILHSLQKHALTELWVSAHTVRDEFWKRRASSRQSVVVWCEYLPRQSRRSGSTDVSKALHRLTRVNRLLSSVSSFLD